MSALRDLVRRLRSDRSDTRSAVRKSGSHGMFQGVESAAHGKSGPGAGRCRSLRVGGLQVKLRGAGGSSEAERADVIHGAGLRRYPAPAPRVLISRLSSCMLRFGDVAD